MKHKNWMDNEVPISKVRISVFIEQSMRTMIRALMATRDASEGEIVREALLRSLPAMVNEEKKDLKNRRESLDYNDVVDDLLHFDDSARLEILETAIRHIYDGEELPEEEDDPQSSERLTLLGRVANFVHRKDLLNRVVPDPKKLLPDDAARFLTLVDKVQTS